MRPFVIITTNAGANETFSKPHTKSLIVSYYFFIPFRVKPALTSNQ